jgi:pimeloyl-ACP methyl ester carboxylesterase
MQVTTSGASIAVEADPGEGLPLLMLMGLGVPRALWPDGFCDRLRARGFRLIRMDNRDVGDSSRLSHLGAPDLRRVLLRATLGLDVGAPYDLGHMADDARAVLDALGIARAHVAGASMGGMIAQTLALEHPDRVASLTSIMSSPGDRRYGWMAKPRAVRALMRPAGRTPEEQVTRLCDTLRAIGSRTLPRDEHELRLLAERCVASGIDPAGFARQFAAICASGSRRAALPGLRLPTLVVHGAQDPLIPLAAARAMARLVPGARLLELAEMGHDLPAPFWDTIADAIAALARSDAERPTQSVSR